MSAENIKNSIDENNHLKAADKNNILNPKRVDINQLLNRVRKEIIFLNYIFPYFGPPLPSVVTQVIFFEGS